MARLFARTKPYGQISAKIIRANGEVVDLGVIASTEWTWKKPWTKLKELRSKQRIQAANSKLE